MKWINVEKELPNIKYPVLVIDCNNTKYVAHYEEKQELKSDISWYYSDCCGCSIVGITHWMELPEAPK